MRLALISCCLALACSVAANVVLWDATEKASGYVREAGLAILKTRMLLDRETVRIIDEGRGLERPI